MTLITQPLRQKHIVAAMLLVFLISMLSQSVSWAAIDTHPSHHNARIDTIEEKHVDKHGNGISANDSQLPCKRNQISALQKEHDGSHAVSMSEAASVVEMDCCGDACQCPVNVCASVASVAILANALLININQFNTYRVESRVDAPSLVSPPQFKPPKTLIAG